MAEKQLVINGTQIRVRYSEMTREMEEKLIAQSIVLAEEDKRASGVVDDKRLATAIREFLTKAEEFGGAEATAWHVVVGLNFVCSLKHESKSLLFFDIVDHHKSVLAFRSG